MEGRTRRKRWTNPALERMNSEDYNKKARRIAGLFAYIITKGYRIV